MQKIKGGITAPKGFKAAAGFCGIKRRRPDLALIVSELPSHAAGLFTSNSFAAAPVVLCREHLSQKKHRAVVVNSGNANCLTGKEGLRDALFIAEGVASLLGCRAS